MARPKSRISLHPNQMRVYRSKARFRVVVAGRRWGKTFLSRAEAIKAARKRNQHVWYVAPTYRMAKQIMWHDLLAAIPRQWVSKINETTLTVRLVNGTRIELKGADKPDSLRGVRIDFLILDEFQDMNPDVWYKVLRPTLVDTGGSAVFIGTPKAYNVLYEVYCNGQDETKLAKGEWASWQFPTSSSPFIPYHELKKAEADMDPKSFRQEFEASFETMAGRVYYPFDRKVHVGKYAFNPSLPIWIGQDFNNDPMASAIIQPQLDGELWVVDELTLHGSNTEETCVELEKRYWRHLKQTTVYPDPAGNQRQHARGETDLDIFREKGFRRLKYRKKNPLVADRVNAVNRMLRSADGRVRLRIDMGCKKLINSLEQTIYKEGGRELDKSNNSEHWTDALGYPIELEFPVRRIQIGGRSL